MTAGWDLYLRLSKEKNNLFQFVLDMQPRHFISVSLQGVKQEGR